MMNDDFTVNYFAPSVDINGFRPVFKTHLKLIEIRNLIKSNI